ncbi:Rid family hydrolase [Hyphomonas sp.]|uniref:RidA family protein n=1 Tax=Hyphomonas sp. TaxID=87 RepID=UPI000A5BFF82|nr:Rid family hydrolase [Hyphomonas sp.]
MTRICIFLALAAAFLLPACVSVDVDEAVLTPDVSHNTGQPIGGQTLPFSRAVRVGHTLYLSGELGIDPATNELVPGGTGAETTQIFRNYERTLATYDADLSDLVKCTVFLGDMGDYAEMNAAYAAAVPDPKPARSTVGVSGLAFGAGLEIECIAALPG